MAGIILIFTRTLICFEWHYTRAGKKDAQVAVSLKAHDTTTRNEWVDALQKCNRASRVAHESAQVCHARGRHQQLSPSLSLVPEARWAADPRAVPQVSAKLAMQGKGSVASLMLEVQSCL